MSKVDSWWKKVLKFFTPLPKEELQPKKAVKELKNFMKLLKKHLNEQGLKRVDMSQTINLLQILTKLGKVVKHLQKRQKQKSQQQRKLR